MEQAVQFFVEQGSYWLMIAALVAAGLGLPLPEDIVMISGAILAQRGITDLGLTVAALAVGVFLGDSALFFIARAIGPRIYEWRFMKRLMPPARRAWLEGHIARHGSAVVFFARHVAGFRGPTFAICAIHGISYVRFILWDLLALAISLPVWMGIGWFFSDRIEDALATASTAEKVVTFGILGVVILLVGYQVSRSIAKRVPGAAAPPPPRESSESISP